MVLELHVQPAGAEDVAQPGGELGGQGDVVAQQGLEDDAAQAAGGGDDAVVVALEAAGYDVFTSRVRVPAWKKLAVAYRISRP